MHMVDSAQKSTATEELCHSLSFPIYFHHPHNQTQQPIYQVSIVVVVCWDENQGGGGGGGGGGEGERGRGRGRKYLLQKQMQIWVVLRVASHIKQRGEYVV